MHTALWIAGIGALVFAALAWMAGRTGRGGSDEAIGAAVGVLFLGGAAGIFGIVWLVLVIIKAASA